MLGNAGILIDMVFTRVLHVNSLEEAILSPTQHPVLVQILSRFVLNLKPLTRNLK